VASFLAFAGMVGSFVVPVQAPGLLVRLGIGSTTLIGLSAGLGLLATLAGSLLWPWMRRTAGAALTNGILLALIACGLLLLIQARSYNGVLLAVSVHGIGAGMLVPNAVARLLEKLPLALRARGVGVFTSCLYLGQFASPLIVALLTGPRQDIPAGIRVTACALLALAAVWAAVALRQHSRAVQSSQTV
jgi:MFS family permease